MELLVAALPGAELPSGVVHALMAYRVGEDHRLWALPVSDCPPGGAMYLDCPLPPEDTSPDSCAGQILRECGRRGFSAIFCDFEVPPAGFPGRLVTRLDGEDITLYVPESFAPFAPKSRVLIPTALTGGTLERTLRQAAERYGRERVVPAIRWLRRDTLLPAGTQGTDLTREALDHLIRRLSPAVFFDRGLCAHYFTYMDGRRCPHFVVFDTPRSVAAKLTLARRLSLPAAVLALPDMEGHLEEILRETGDL